jgi:hypothetical protein
MTVSLPFVLRTLAPKCDCANMYYTIQQKGTFTVPDNQCTAYFSAQQSAKAEVTMQSRRNVRG